MHLSRSGLKAQDKKVDLESAKRLNEADKRLMQTLRGVMREKEREKMKEALLAKKRREARLRAGALRGVCSASLSKMETIIHTRYVQPTQLLRPTTKTVQKVVSVKKNTATPIKKAPLLPKKALPQLPQKGDVPPEKKQASFAAPHSPIVSKQESKKYAKVVIQPAAIVIQEVVEEDKENSDTQELSQHLIQFDNETEWMMQGLKDEVKINRKEHISKKIMSTEEGCQTEPVHWQELEKVYDEDGPTTEKSLQPEWIINNDDGFRQVLNVPTLDQSHASTSLDHQTPSILDFDIPRNALFAEDAEAFCFTRSAAGATEDSKPNISALTTTVRPKLSLSKKSSERIAKGRQCFIDCMEVWIGTLHDDKAISPWDVLTRYGFFHYECYVTGNDCLYKWTDYRMRFLMSICMPSVRISFKSLTHTWTLFWMTS